MSEPDNKLPYFREYAADELADNRKRVFTAEQWGWYTLLKMASWQSEEKGRLPADEKGLQQLALAKITKANRRQWESVLGCFKKVGKWLVHPELDRQFAKFAPKLKKLSRAGSISAAKKSLAALAADDPARADVEKRLASLTSKTKAGRQSSKTAAVQTQLQLAPGTVSPDGRQLWYVDPISKQGQWMFRTQLEKLKKDLCEELAKLQNSRPNGRGQLGTDNVCYI